MMKNSILILRQIKSKLSLKYCLKNEREVGLLYIIKKVEHQISVSFEKFDVVQGLLSFFLHYSS
jgi:hypothetical protein